jgi:hypothetical protein
MDEARYPNGSELTAEERAASPGAAALTFSSGADDTIPPATLADARASFRALGNVGACVLIALFLAMALFGGCTPSREPSSQRTIGPVAPPKQPDRFTSTRVGSPGIYHVVDTVSGAEFLMQYPGGFVALPRAEGGK